MKKVRESIVEGYLGKQVKLCNGLCIKFLPSLFAGLPDRIVLLPCGRIYFIELKAPGKKPSKLQKIIHRKITDLGFIVLVIDTKEGVNEFINDYKLGLI